MHRLSRIITALVLVTLTVNLGDWPYVDELLDDLNEQTQSAQAADDSSVSSVTDTQDGRHDVQLGMGYRCLNAPPIPQEYVDGIHCTPLSTHYPPLVIATAEFILDGPFRPPAA